MKLHHSRLEEASESIRIFDYVLKHFSFVFPSKSAVKKAFKRELIFLNGIVVEPGTWLMEGDLVEVKQRPAKASSIFKLSLEIVYEDEYIAVVNKPSGFPVSGNFFKTIQNALPYNLSVSNNEDALAAALPVHRLDASTSGLLIIAKTRTAHMSVAKQFENREIKKTYMALVKGSLEDSGTINLPINGLTACTAYKTIRVENSLSNGRLSLVELEPQTGRTHQLRIHMSELGHPIIGDALYDKKNVLRGKGLFLSATKLKFKHPIDHDLLSIELPTPNKFDTYIHREMIRWNKFTSSLN